MAGLRRPGIRSDGAGKGLSFDPERRSPTKVLRPRAPQDGKDGNLREPNKGGEGKRGLIVKDEGWRRPEEFWEKVEPLLPLPKAHPLGCPNPRVPNRKAMEAILFVLRTGGQGNALNAPGICSSSSAPRRFQEGVKAGVFRPLGVVSLQE